MKWPELASLALLLLWLSRQCSLWWLESLQLDEIQQQCITNVCQPGENLLAAGYCMYSSSVILVLSVGSGVFGFTLDPMYGEFVLTHANIQIPKSGKIYSFNEGNYELWSDPLKKYINDLKVRTHQPSPQTPVQMVLTAAKRCL